MLHFRRTWIYILTQREKVETVALIAVIGLLLVGATAGAIAFPPPPEILFRIFGIDIRGEISLGTLLSAMVIMWQIGRWGRRMVLRFSQLPQQIEILMAQMDQMRDIIREVRELRAIVKEINLMCPLRSAARKEECGL